MKLDAILWDYDGTLVNSVPKNMAITKSILEIVAPHLTGDNLPLYLQTEALYHQANHSAKNWQELYLQYYGLTHDEMLLAGSMWAEHQLNNQTPVMLFDGIKQVVTQFSQLPHGICSQNAQHNIRSILSKNGIHNQFKAVVGYDDVPSQYQKPHPMGGMKCLEAIYGHKQRQQLIYIGDHEADTQFARSLQLALGDQAQVISIAAAYSGSQPQDWTHQPDHIAYGVEDLVPIINQYL